MDYIKFDTITSTNDFLKSYAETHKIPDFFYVLADAQTKGRGQRSNIWKSECCENILISIYLKPDMPLSQQLQLNQIVAVSIVKVLQKFNIPNVRIKLPNDILADGKKIAGILIENKVIGQNWLQSIIGIGLNVNQTNFVNLPLAVSMKQFTGINYNRDEIVKLLIKQLKICYQEVPEMVQNKFNNLLIHND